MLQVADLWFFVKLYLTKVPTCSAGGLAQMP